MFPSGSSRPRSEAEAFAVDQPSSSVLPVRRLCGCPVVSASFIEKTLLSPVEWS